MSVYGLPYGCRGDLIVLWHEYLLFDDFLS